MRGIPPTTEVGGMRKGNVTLFEISGPAKWSVCVVHRKVGRSNNVLLFNIIIIIYMLEFGSNWRKRGTSKKNQAATPTQEGSVLTFVCSTDSECVKLTTLQFQIYCNCWDHLGMQLAQSVEITKTPFAFVGVLVKNRREAFILFNAFHWHRG